MFSPKAKQQFREKFAEWEKATGSHLPSFDSDQLGKASRAVETLKYNAAFQAWFLDSRGIAPEIVKTSKNAEELQKLKDNGFEKWLGDTDWQKLMRDEEFQQAVQNMYPAELQDLFSTPDARRNLARDVAMQIERIAKEGAEERVDKYATQDRVS